MTIHQLSAAELESEAEAIDQAVCQTPDVDRFCSSSLWVLPAWQAFLPDHRLWALRGSEGYTLLAVGEDKGLGTYVHPLEASWALACPFLGKDARAVAGEFVELSLTTPLKWDILFLSGIRPDSVHFHTLLRGYRGHYSLGLGPSSRRCIASLEGGIDGYMQRRSAKFRRNVRRADRRAREAGMESELYRCATAEECSLLLERALAIEAKSWKGNLDTGIINSPMEEFYQNMLPRLSRRGSLRFLFLTLHGVDVAYCFGAVFDGGFRGLQMSFVDEYKDHSPGSLAQFWMIESLCEEGINSYDLGSDMEYKKDWSEETMETLAVVVRRS